MALKTIKPAALHPGDTIGVMATSSWVSQADLDQAKKFLENMGYKVRIHPQAALQLHQSAGTADQKVEAFHDLVRDPSVKAIFVARGGNRALTMLAGIDFNLVAANPKIIMGYSDVTTLLNAVTRNTGLITFHGPLYRELPQRDAADISLTFDLLAGKMPAYDFSGAAVIREGVAEGRLVGGNLSVLQAMAGTPYAPDTDGAILFIEDTGDHISRYDRMLAHLKLAGWFNRLSGVIVGRFSKTGDDPDRPYGFTLEDIVSEHFRDLDIPLVMNAPFGHDGALPALPVGSRARLEAGPEGTVSFSLTEPAVKP